MRARPRAGEGFDMEAALDTQTQTNVEPYVPQAFINVAIPMHAHSVLQYRQC